MSFTGKPVSKPTGRKIGVPGTTPRKPANRKGPVGKKSSGKRR